MLSTRNSLSIQRHIHIKWIKIRHANTNQKQTSAAALISDGADFQVRKVIRETKGHRVMISKSALQEDITTLYTYAPNNRASNRVTQKPIEP